MPKGRVTVDVSRCKGCHLCIRVCPQGVLGVAKEINIKGFHPAEAQNLEKCTGCTLCAVMCPDVVLRVERE